MEEEEGGRLTVDDGLRELPVSKEFKGVSLVEDRTAARRTRAHYYRCTALGLWPGIVTVPRGLCSVQSVSRVVGRECGSTVSQAMTEKCEQERILGFWSLIKRFD